MNRDNIYFLEGECEENFVKSFKTGRMITPGKVKKANFWEITNINKILRQLPRSKANIFVIFDTDVTSELERFKKNITALSKNASKLILLPQHNNFEDEAAYACQVLTRDLPFHLYRCRTTQDCKTRLAQDKNLIENLGSKGFNCSRMWSRRNCISTLRLAPKNINWGVSNILL